MLICFSSAFAWAMACAAQLLGDRLLPETRALIRDNVRRRVVQPYLDMIEGRRPLNWWVTATSNWNAVCLAA